MSTYLYCITVHTILPPYSRPAWSFSLVVNIPFVAWSSSCRITCPVNLSVELYFGNHIWFLVQIVRFWLLYLLMQMSFLHSSVYFLRTPFIGFQSISCTFVSTHTSDLYINSGGIKVLYKIILGTTNGRKSSCILFVFSLDSIQIISTQKFSNTEVHKYHHASNLALLWKSTQTKQSICFKITSSF